MTGRASGDAAGEIVPLLNIGDFSRYAGLSVRMLRHYDERGLLVPAEVDPFTGYRRYTPDQLRIAGRIRSLRDAGCGIPVIAELLPLYGQASSLLRHRLQEHIAGLDEDAGRLAAQRKLAVSLVAAIDGSDVDSSGDGVDGSELVVSEREFPAARVLLLRRTVACYPAEGELWADLKTLMTSSAGVDPAGFGELIGATYFDAEYRDESACPRPVTCRLDPGRDRGGHRCALRPDNRGRVRDSRMPGVCGGGINARLAIGHVPARAEREPPAG